MAEKLYGRIEMFEDLSLHILDIVENSIRAEAKNIKIKITENLEKDLLVIEIEDDGKGMSKKMIERVLDPFVTTKPKHKVGLGLSFLAQASRMANGDLKIKSEMGKGTKIKATFQHSHIDRQPLGDMVETMMTLVTSNPKINFIYQHQKNGKKYIFNTKILKKKYENLSFSKALKIIRENLETGLSKLNNGG